MTARSLLSRQVEESQRNAMAKLNRDREREREILNEKAKEAATIAAKTGRLKALRLAKEAIDREAALNAPPPAAKATKKRVKKSDKP